MILQAVPYFQRRFKEDPWILRYFQAFYLVVFAITMSTVTIFLAAKDGKNLYTSRLRGSLIAYVAVASMLMLSTIGKFHLDAKQYFPFTLGMVVVTAVANAMSQNAAFAFAAGFGRTEYAPAIMTGEAVAGLLPSTIGKKDIF
jgi:equilibrative nucleoside transporter 1/2/3